MTTKIANSAHSVAEGITPQNSTYWRGILLALLCILPIAIAGQSRVSLLSSLLLATCGYTAHSLTSLVLASRVRIVSVIFWTYMYIFMGLAPLVQSSAGRWPWPAAVTEPTASRTALLNLACMAAYQLGAAHRSGELGLAVRPAERILRIDRSRLVIAASMPITIAVLLKLGGPTIVLHSRQSLSAVVQGQSTSNAGVGILYALLTVPSFVAAYLYITQQKNLRGMWAVLGMSSLALCLLVSNPLSFSRYTCATVWGALALRALWPVGPKLVLMMTSALVVGLGTLFPYLNSFRSDRRENGWRGSFSDSFLSGDFDSFQQVNSIVVLTERHGYAHGEQLLGAILFWVPRSLWSGKPLDTGILVAQDNGYTFTNLSAPLSGELYLNGGILAAVAGFLLYGRVARKLEATHLHSTMTFSSLLLPVAALYQVIILRGSLIQAMGGISAIAIMLWLCTVPEKTATSTGLPASPETVSATQAARTTTNQRPRPGFSSRSVSHRA